MKMISASGYWDIQKQASEAALCYVLPAQGLRQQMLNALSNVTQLRSNFGFEPVWMTPFLHDVNDFLEITCFGKPTAAMFFTCKVLSVNWS